MPEGDRDRGIDVRTGDVAERGDHRRDNQGERYRNADMCYDAGIGDVDRRGTRPHRHQHRGANELGRGTLAERNGAQLVVPMARTLASSASRSSDAIGSASNSSIRRLSSRYASKNASRSS